jgi:hypothetical protein
MLLPAPPAPITEICGRAISMAAWSVSFSIIDSGVRMLFPKELPFSEYTMHCSKTIKISFLVCSLRDITWQQGKITPVDNQNVLIGFTKVGLCAPG